MSARLFPCVVEQTGCNGSERMARSGLSATRRQPARAPAGAADGGCAPLSQRQRPGCSSARRALPFAGSVREVRVAPSSFLCAACAFLRQSIAPKTSTVHNVRWH